MRRPAVTLFAAGAFVLLAAFGARLGSSRPARAAAALDPSQLTAAVLAPSDLGGGFTVILQAVSPSATVVAGTHSYLINSSSGYLTQIDETLAGASSSQPGVARVTVTLAAFLTDFQARTYFSMAASNVPSQLPQAVPPVIGDTTAIVSGLVDATGQPDVQVLAVVGNVVEQVTVQIAQMPVTPANVTTAIGVARLQATKLQQVMAQGAGAATPTPSATPSLSPTPVPSPSATPTATPVPTTAPTPRSPISYGGTDEDPPQPAL